ATAAWEIATRIKEWCALPKHEIRNVDVKVIMISNDPSKPSIGPAAEAPEQPEQRHTKSVLVHGQFIAELTAPLYTLLNARYARGTYAQKEIGIEQRRFKVGMISSA